MSSKKLAFKKHKNGIISCADTGFVIRGIREKEDRVVIGKLVDEKVVELTENDIEKCKELGLTVELKKEDEKKDDSQVEEVKLKVKVIDPFLIDSYNIYKELMIGKTKKLFQVKTITFQGIRDVYIRLELNRKLETYHFDCVIGHDDIHIYSDGCYNPILIGVEKHPLPTIKPNMSKEEFCTEIDNELKNCLDNVKRLKYCKVENLLTNSEKVRLSSFPKNYLSNWKDVDFREPDCVICYDNCGTYMRCCKKPVCIACVSRIVHDSECPHCKHDHLDYAREEELDEDRFTPHIYMIE